MKPSPPDWIHLGVIARAHGIKGAMLLKLFHPDGESLVPGIRIVLMPSGKEFEVEECLAGDRLFLKNIETRTDAEKLRGAEIWIRRSDFAEISADEVYLVDLLGFGAVSPEGTVLGEVTGFSDNGAQLLVQIGTALVPFIKPILVKIDEPNRQIILNLPEGYEL